MSPDAPEKQSKYDRLRHAVQNPFSLRLQVARVGQDHVIEHVDPHQHAGRHQPLASAPRHPRSARGSPDGMVVEQDDRRGAGAGRLAEDLARVDDARVERPDRHDRSSGARGASCRAARRRTARPAGCRTAAAGARPPIARRRDLRRARGRAASDRAAAQLHRRDDLRGPRRADPGTCDRSSNRARAQPLEAADRRQHGVGEIQRARARPAVAQHDGQQLVVARAPSHRGAGAFRAADRAGATVFIVHHPCYTSGPMRRACRPACAPCSSAPRCSEPPQKEIDRAQGAIDAARAAGAEQYAADRVRRRDDGAPAGARGGRSARLPPGAARARSTPASARRTRPGRRPTARPAPAARPRPRSTPQPAAVQQLETKLKTLPASQTPDPDVKAAQDVTADARRRAAKSARVCVGRPVW